MAKQENQSVSKICPQTTQGRPPPVLVFGRTEGTQVSARTLGSELQAGNLQHIWEKECERVLGEQDDTSRKARES